MKQRIEEAKLRARLAMAVLKGQSVLYRCNVVMGEDRTEAVRVSGESETAIVSARNGELHCVENVVSGDFVLPQEPFDLNGAAA